jgi:hypothetical protein
MTWPSDSEPGQPTLAADATAASRPVRYSEQVALVDLLDRVLAGGVVIAGDVTLSIAGVDLVVISLRALIASTASLAKPPARPRKPAYERA